MIAVAGALAARLWGWILPRWGSVAMAAALLAAIGWLAITRGELRAFADRACAAAGVPQGGDMAPCEARIRALARFEREAATQSARLLAEAAAARDAKAAADERSARNDAAAANAAAGEMEKADAKVGADGRIDGQWLDALNHAGGLRAPAH